MAEAVESSQKSLEIRQEIGDLWGEAYSLDDLGLALLRLDQLAEALPCFVKSQMIFVEIGNERGVATALNHQGFTAVAQSHFGQAQRHFEAALTIAETLQATPQILEAQVGLASCLAHTGEPEEAMKLLTFVLEHPACSFETAVYGRKIFAFTSQTR